MEISEKLRASDPAFALACDAITMWENLSVIQKATIDLKDQRIAQLEAEIATLRAQVSARDAA